MPADNPDLGPASLVVAITGHRDLDERDPWYEAQVCDIFRDLHKQYRHTPLLLLSGLAIGGDRIAVRAALAESVPYIAVLPMPAASYRQDFVDEDSDAQFEKLLKSALRIIELPFDPSVSRDGHYENLGRFLVQYSQILIAIWDENRAAKSGGTTHVVAMKLREDSPAGRLAFIHMNSNGAGPVYVIPVRKSGVDSTLALKREIRYPESSLPEEYKASYNLLARFNTDVVKAVTAGRYFPRAVIKSRANLFAGEEAIGVSGAMEWVAQLYAQADALAIHFSRVSLGLWKAIFILLALSGISLALLHVLSPRGNLGTAITLAAYYAFLLSAAGLIVWEWLAKRRGRHEDYRSLAEALRVQFFWMAAGLPDLAAEQYLRKQAGEMVWIRDAISECGLYEGVLDRSPAARDDLPLRLRLAHNWIVNQANYFAQTRHSHELKKNILTVFAWFAAAVGLVAPLFGLHEGYETLAHAVAAPALWLSALAWNYMERRGYEQEARQYARMYLLFHDADEDLKRFEREKNLDAAEETIRKLGCEALTETGDWLSMHRERKLSVHMAAGG